MVDLVGLASIEDKDKFKVAQEAFQAQCRAESMIRASHSLLSIIHSMKLLLLLSDETQIANRRDVELKKVQAESDDTQKKVAALLDELLHPSTSETRQDAAMDTS
ncbi:Mediator of RNA polymerase II transcription subunit 22 [Sparassis crispa]|uniref:Mediator of RNA polymerase II transcription subunit 22 n=1 Tax=Sparassis crispa TaxID=139825 RepID=A0A401H1R1_9APHY|nr:Mediator of RNA polymerase II transcription subunit 22 [Sparassis crispa]GBE88300.1 Mediator of RNA polymerase II transcription subunit 22 [Sparassis crispa]